MNEEKITVINAQQKREREQRYWEERLRIGVELFDMHYGWQPVAKDFLLGETVEWRWLDKKDTYMREAFYFLLNSAAKRNNATYTNKMLIIIAEPDANDYWTCGWAYDGRGFGMTQLMLRYLKQGRDG